MTVMSEGLLLNSNYITVKPGQAHPPRKGVCKTRTGYLRMADADGKMQIEKCG